MKKSADTYGKPLYYALGYGVSLLVSILLFMLFAFIICAADLQKSTAYPLSSLALGIGGGIGAYVGAVKTKKNGILCGIAVGGLLSFTFTVTAIIINGSNFTSLWFIRFTIVLLSSIIGGIIGVNKVSRKSLVK